MKCEKKTSHIWENWRYFEGKSLKMCLFGKKSMGTFLYEYYSQKCVQVLCCQRQTTTKPKVRNVLKQPAHPEKQQNLQNVIHMYKKQKTQIIITNTYLVSSLSQLDYAHLEQNQQTDVLIYRMHLLQELSPFLSDYLVVYSSLAMPSPSPSPEGLWVEDSGKIGSSRYRFDPLSHANGQPMVDMDEKVSYNRWNHFKDSNSQNLRTWFSQRFLLLSLREPKWILVDSAAQPCSGYCWFLQQFLLLGLRRTSSGSCSQ